jgi:hypothetical protein
MSSAIAQFLVKSRTASPISIIDVPSDARLYWVIRIFWSRSSVGEHCLDMAGVTSSILVATTIPSKT